VPKRERKETSVKLVYRFESEIAPVVPLRLKVEINTREHEAVLPRIRVPFAVTSPWFAGRSEIPTFALPELLGTKLRALYQRKKGRDLFDFAVTLDRLGDDEARDVVRCFLHYLERGGQRASRAELEENLAGKRSDPAFGADVRLLLVPGTKFDRERALDRVLARLVTLVPGEPWTPPKARPPR